MTKSVIDPEAAFMPDGQLHPVVFAAMERYLLQHPEITLPPAAPAPSVQTATQGAEAASASPVAAPEPAAEPSLPTAPRPFDETADPAADLPALPAGRRRRADWTTIAMMLGRGAPILVAAEYGRVTPKQIRRHFRRSAEFRALVQASQRHRVELARRQLVDVMTQWAADGLKKALLDGSPAAVNFAVRQLAAGRLGLGSPAWNEFRIAKGEPTAAEITLGDLVWHGPK